MLQYLGMVFAILLPEAITNDHTSITSMSEYQPLIILIMHELHELAMNSALDVPICGRCALASAESLRSSYNMISQPVASQIAMCLYKRGRDTRYLVFLAAARLFNVHVSAYRFNTLLLASGQSQSARGGLPGS